MKKNNVFTLWNIMALLLIGLMIMAFGCAKTQQAKTVEQSGFLGDYTQLQEGKGDMALYHYINPEADFSAYDKIVLDSVTIWAGEDSKMGKIPKQDLDNLAHYLYAAVKEQLEKDYRIVDAPGEGTMRIRLALTEAGSSVRVMDVLSTYLPPARLISESKKLATGTHAFVGRASVELDVIDSVTNRRLVAVMDKRAGGKHYKGSTDTWAHVKQAADYWAEQISGKFKELRSK